MINNNNEMTREHRNIMIRKALLDANGILRYRALNFKELYADKLDEFNTLFLTYRNEEQYLKLVKDFYINRVEDRVAQMIEWYLLKIERGDFIEMDGGYFNEYDLSIIEETINRIILKGDMELSKKYHVEGLPYHYVEQEERAASAIANVCLKDILNYSFVK